MNRQVVLIAIAIFAILAGLAAIVLRQPDEPTGSTMEPSGAESPDSGESATADEMLEAVLYFPGTGGLLRSERRELPPSPDASGRTATVIQALLTGPQGTGLRAPLPEGIAVRKVYLAEDGLAFIDFESPEGAPPPASGSTREILTVYSLVNTVLLNSEEVDRLVLLWNGRQLKTFAGHVDTTRPLVANTALVAQSSRTQ